MKTNILTLMKLIKEEERKLSSLTYSLGSVSINKTNEELDGTINIITDNKAEFDARFKELNETINKLRKYKKALYDKNNAFKLSDGRSIQDAIVDNTYLRKLKSIYEGLNDKGSKVRINDDGDTYFECTTLNYDSKAIKDELYKIKNKIDTTDYEISILNSKEFTI